MRELPSGTVTFLFTDIEGSTRLLHELGDGYAGVLGEHRRLLREAFVAHDGVEVDTQGDAFFVAFPRATGAVAAAVAAQRALAGGPVRVRMGVHTGEPLVTEEGYVGVDVHRAARVMSAGHGGQVLVSDATYRLLDGVEELLDLGEHRLKDLTAPQRLYQLGRELFPPLKTLQQSNLPVQPTPLVGRRRELEELRGLVRAHWLVTVTGTGGSGKTRVALQVAADLVDEFPDGVLWISLAAVRDVDRVVPAIAAAVGADDLSAHLRAQQTLLVLDNFEQVVEAAPRLVEVLNEAPGVRLLVTSREPLRLSGEQEYSLEPLREQEAIELFSSRARLVQPGFEPDEHVAEICVRLDCLPLAVELAAARIKLLAPDALLTRLTQRLDVLGVGARDAPDRQRTLTATIEWSYDLLVSEEQDLFARLSVFAGGWTLEAAEAVCHADLDTLESLLAKNLVRAGDGGRFFMLETIREFATGRLDEQDRRRHAEYYLELALSANLAADAHGPQRNELVLADQQNMRVALAWTLAANEIERLLELVVALENFWATNDPDEGKRWIAAALGSGVEVPQLLLARALRVQGGMSNVRGTFEEAQVLFRESLAAFEALGHEQGIAILKHRLATSARMRGEWGRARELAEQSLAGHRRTGFRKGETQALTMLAYVALDDGDAQRALQLLREAAAIAEEIGFRWWLAGVSADIALVTLDLGEAAAAEPWARRTLELAAGIRDRRGTVVGLALLAEIAGAGGDAERSGRLWGAVESEFERGPVRMFTIWLVRELRAERVLAGADALFERGRSAGRELALDEAVSAGLTSVD
ncbi:MAG: adenylate/guanylate cyclase domain-containing protein [Gaiellaceae bacterium]